MIRSSLVTFFAITLIAPSLAAEPATWEQWRGPSRDGWLPEAAAAWPADLSKLERVWRVDLAEGYSSPIVSGDHVFTVETKDKKDEIVRALRREDGGQVWEHSWAGAMKVPFFARKNGSWVRCTPAFADGTLYVGGMRDVLVAIDVATGEERWRVDFVERESSPVPGFGFVSSPVIDGDHLYVQAGSEIAKLNREDGSKVWGAMKDDRAMYGSAFSSPVIAEVAGKPQVLAQTREELAGIDPEKGEVLWRYKVKAFRGMNILTPTVLGDTLFTSTYGGGSYLFTVSTDGENMDASKTWFHKVEGYMSSPIAHEGHVYLHGRDQRFHCFEAESGELKWSSEEKFGEYVSLVAHGERALGLSSSGELLLLELDADGFKLVGREKVADAPTWAHLAVCGDELYIRELKGLSKWRWTE